MSGWSVVVCVLVFPIIMIICIKFGYFCWSMNCYPDTPLHSVWCDAGDWSVAVFTRDNKEHIMGSFVSIAAY